MQYEFIKRSRVCSIWFVVKHAITTNKNTVISYWLNIIAQWHNMNTMRKCRRRAYWCLLAVFELWDKPIGLSRQTEKQTDMQTDWSQYFTLLTWRSDSHYTCDVLYVWQDSAILSVVLYRYSSRRWPAPKRSTDIFATTSPRNSTAMHAGTCPFACCIFVIVPMSSWCLIFTVFAFYRPGRPVDPVCGRVSSSVLTITIELNNFWPRCLSCCFIFALCRSN